MENNTFSESKYRILNRDTIKYIAVLTMTLNHYANCFLEKDTNLYWALIYIGFFTAPIMCYFLVEGYYYTRSKNKYAFRLLAFALLSQLPYQMAFRKSEKPDFVGFNMIFTLFICFLILLCLDNISNYMVKTLAVFSLTALTLLCDWALLAPIFVIAFHNALGDKNKTAGVFGIGTVYVFLEGIGYALTAHQEPGNAFLWGIWQCSGIILAGITILCFYNGKKSAHSGKFSKWFFYIYYPAHLLVFALLRMSP